jgi:hypothetical protein
MPDIRDGWKPEKKVSAAPIPLRFRDNDMDRVETSIASRMIHQLSGTVLF